MGDADNRHDRRDAVSRRGDQAQGGISRAVTERARREHDPGAGVPEGPGGSEPLRVPDQRLPHAGDTGEAGFTGDDGRHVPADTSAQPADLMPDQATAPEGGVGGRSGTGQAKPHRPFDENEGKQAMEQPVDPQNDLPEPSVGADYQSGGTRGDRAQQVEERKLQEPGGGMPRNPSGAADPAPGSQPRRHRPPPDRW